MMGWQVQTFPSGTHIVADTDRDRARDPHLYVYGPVAGEDFDRDRYAMCKQLAEFLNGGNRPKWLDDMERISEVSLVGADASSIMATGPSYDANPPHLDWRQCDDEESRNARARLIDRLT